MMERKENIIELKNIKKCYDKDVDEMEEIGYEDYFYGEGLCIIEWGNLISDILPEGCMEIRIEKDLEKGFDYRRITISESGEGRKA